MEEGILPGGGCADFGYWEDKANDAKYQQKVSI